MKKKVLFGTSALFGLMMINSGFNKFFNYMPIPEMNEQAGSLMMAFAESGWIFPLIAIIEIIGGALFITNRFRALGAIMMLPITVGILLFHAVLDPSTVVLSIILIAINIWAIIENIDKYLPMIKEEA